MNRQINTDGLDNFFSFISKAVIIIPIFVLIISLFFRFNQPKTNLINQNLTEVQAPKLGVSTKNDTFKINLQGPIVCNNLFIKNKKVLLKNKTINYLLNGDCLYIWETGKINGEKKCQLTNYVNMAENYLGLLSVDDLINNNMIKDKIKDKNINLTDIIKNCRSEKIKDASIFEIPKQVIFSDKK